MSFAAFGVASYLANGALFGSNEDSQFFGRTYLDQCNDVRWKGHFKFEDYLNISAAAAPFLADEFLGGIAKLTYWWNSVGSNFSFQGLKDERHGMDWWNTTGDVVLDVSRTVTKIATDLWNVDEELTTAWRKFIAGHDDDGRPDLIGPYKTKKDSIESEDQDGIQISLLMERVRDPILLNEVRYNSPAFSSSWSDDEGIMTADSTELNDSSGDSLTSPAETSTNGQTDRSHSSELQSDGSVSLPSHNNGIFVDSTSLINGTSDTPLFPAESSIEGQSDRTPSSGLQSDESVPSSSHLNGILVHSIEQIGVVPDHPTITFVFSVNDGVYQSPEDSALIFQHLQGIHFFGENWSESREALDRYPLTLRNAEYQINLNERNGNVFSIAPQ